MLVLAGDEFALAVIMTVIAVVIAVKDMVFAGMGMAVIVMVMRMPAMSGMGMAMFVSVHIFRHRKRICRVSPFPPCDEVRKIPDPGAENELDPAHREDRERLFRPGHIGEEQDEESLVAGRDKDGEKRSERDVLPLVQLCRHDGEAAHGHKPRCTADERPDLARERAGGAPDAGIVLHQFDEDI